MKIRTVLMSAAVAAVLAASGTANAQLLGGGASGGLGGSITGGLGNVGARRGWHAERHAARWNRRARPHTRHQLARRGEGESGRPRARARAG